MLFILLEHFSMSKQNCPSICFTQDPKSENFPLYHFRGRKKTVPDVRRNKHTPLHIAWIIVTGLIHAWFRVWCREMSFLKLTNFLWREKKEIPFCDPLKRCVRNSNNFKCHLLFQDLHLVRIIVKLNESDWIHSKVIVSVR